MLDYPRSWFSIIIIAAIGLSMLAADAVGVTLILRYMHKGD
jgi:hypothetical protein